MAVKFLFKKGFSLGVLVIFCMSGCATLSAKDLYKEGKEATKSLREEMQKIHTKDELIAAIPRLRKKYLRLARLAIKAEGLIEMGEKPFPPSQECDELYAEIARLYELPGGRELLKSAQAESLKQFE